MILAVDLGKTSCRAAARGRRSEGPGAPGLAAPGGMRAAEAAILAVAREFDPADEVIVGAAGALAAPDAARALGDALLASLRAKRVAVTSDAVIAHAGALDGKPGVVLIAGTGVVALAIGADGTLRTADGWGPWLGDEGGGAWIGAAGPARGAARPRRPRPVHHAARRRPRPLRRAGDLARAAHRCRRDGVLRARRPRRAGRRRGDGDRQRRRRGARRDRPRGRGWPGGDGRRVWRGWRRCARGSTSSRPPATRSMARCGWATIHEPHVIRVQAGGAFTQGSTRSPPRPCGQTWTTLTRGPSARSSRCSSPPRARRTARWLAAVPRIAAAAEAIAARLQRGGRLIYAGAGTPGRLGVLDAAECGPTFGTDVVRGVIAGGAAALTAAIEGAEDTFDPADLAGLTAADALVGITASGRTPYVLGALEHARAAGALTVAIVNNPSSAASADVVIELLTGPEVLAGSTRLTAGTAQKVVLNALSTSVMIALGRAYGPRMVDVRVTNAKLRRRAVRIVRDAAGVDEETATAALAAAGGHAKTAIVALLAGVDAAEAAVRLDRARGRVRDALGGT